MANKKSKKTNTFDSNKYLKMTLLAIISLFAVIGAAYVFGAGASRVIPSGTISVSNNGSLKYGDSANFVGITDGRYGPNDYSYVSLVCRTPEQKAAGHIGLQYSKGLNVYPGSYSVEIPLVDQVGQGLDYPSDKPAECIAWLVFRNDTKRGKSGTTIEKMAEMTFYVNSASGQQWYEVN